MTTPPLPLVDVEVVRIRVGVEKPSPQPDPLGRDLIGFRPGLSIGELWLRSRGVWKAKLPHVAAADLAVIVHKDRVVLVSTVAGVRFYGDRVAIEGQPLPTHPLIGAPDPVPNDSRNPIAYGTVRTVPGSVFAASSPAPQRSFDEVLHDAITVLTEAGRRRRPVYAQGENGMVVDPSRTEPADWAEFLTLALAGAAANLGGIEQALAGRPGSWEASRIRDTLISTVGEDEAELMRHRTEPLRVRLTDDDLWRWWDEIETLYTVSEDDIAARAEAARAPFRAAEPEQWIYRRTDTEWTQGVGMTAPFECDDPTAPAWPEALERARDDARACGAPETYVAGMPWPTGTEVSVSKSDEDRAELARLDELSEQATAQFERLSAALHDLRTSDYETLRARVTHAIQAEAARRFPGVTVEIVDTGDAPDEDLDSPEERLLDHARQTVLLPGIELDAATASRMSAAGELAGFARRDGRLPHQRIEGTTDGR